MTDENVLDNVDKEESDPILDQLVGPDKRYKTTEALAKGRMEADSFIENLKSENAEMRKSLTELESKVNEGKTVSELMNHIKDLTSSDSNGNNQAGQTKEELTELVSNLLTEQQRESKLNSNYAKANATLLKYFDGDADKARDYVKSKSSELGVDISVLKSLGQTSPVAFSKLIGITSEDSNKSSSYNVTSLNSTNVEGDNPFSTEIRNKKYYSNLRRKLGMSKFYDPQIQVQKWKDKEKLGDRWYD